MDTLIKLNSFSRKDYWFQQLLYSSQENCLYKHIYIIAYSLQNQLQYQSFHLCLSFLFFYKVFFYFYNFFYIFFLLQTVVSDVANIIFFFLFYVFLCLCFCCVINILDQHVEFHKFLKSAAVTNENFKQQTANNNENNTNKYAYIYIHTQTA